MAGINPEQTTSKELKGTLEDKKFTFPHLTSNETSVPFNDPGHLSALREGLLRTK